MYRWLKYREFTFVECQTTVLVSSLRGGARRSKKTLDIPLGIFSVAVVLPVSLRYESW